MNKNISDTALQLDALDGLRGFAALIVILSHTSNSSMFFIPFLDARGIGKSGVFLFFLLSSFLLSRALIKQGSSAFSKQSISHYAQRRFFRIYPLYVVYLLLGLVSTAVLGTYFNISEAGIPFSLTIQEFFKHILLMDGKGVTWSIAVEFKFYFILPVIIFFSQLIKNKWSHVAQFAFLLFLVVLTQVVSPQNESMVNDSRLLPYMCIFLLGVVLATIQCEVESGNFDKKYFKPIVPLSYISCILLLCMTPSVVSIVIGEVENSYFHREFLQYSFLWSVVLLSIVNFKSKLSAIFEMKWLCFYGALSFSIYLFHPIFLGIVRKLMLNSYLSAWLVLLTSTTASYISYKMLELPASRLKIPCRNPIARTPSNSTK